MDRTLVGVERGPEARSTPLLVERGRELTQGGNARLPGYLGPELVFSSVSTSSLEVFLRLHHRSGAGGLFGGMTGGSDANVFGLRYWF
jgi:hypothetical protein